MFGNSGIPVKRLFDVYLASLDLPFLVFYLLDTILSNEYGEKRNIGCFSSLFVKQTFKLDYKYKFVKQTVKLNYKYKL